MRRIGGILDLKPLLAAAVVSACFSVNGMDRWCALSQIESGDRDCAVGPKGEVSRYQFLPEVWRVYAPTNADCQNAQDALAVAQVVMKERCSEFERNFHRPPTDFEFYVLWNAPARVANPSKCVRERAERFCNLVADDEPSLASRH
jgi:hypothetical protein